MWNQKLCHSNEGNEDLVGILISKHVDCNVKDFSKRTPLHLAAMSGSLSVVKMISNRTNEIDASDIYGRTSLYLAAEYGNFFYWYTLMMNRKMVAN